MEDFGFSFTDAVDEESFTERNNQLEADNELLFELVKDLRADLREQSKRVNTLLTNLKQNSDKPNIYWPNRAEKIDNFIEDLNEIALRTMHKAQYQTLLANRTKKINQKTFEGK